MYVHYLKFCRDYGLSMIKVHMNFSIKTHHTYDSQCDFRVILHESISLTDLFSCNFL